MKKTLAETFAGLTLLLIIGGVAGMFAANHLTEFKEIVLKWSIIAFIGGIAPMIASILLSTADQVNRNNN